VSDLILSVLEQPAAAGTLLAATQRLAEISGATRINVLVVRAPPETMVSPSEEVLTARLEAKLHADEAARAATLRTAFDAWSANLPAGVDADWVDTDGIAELVVEDRGRRADFLTIGLPAPEHHASNWRALRAALFTTDRPVLVVPERFSGDFGRRVAIAWRNDERATKAVLAGLRCLKSAEGVFVLAGQRAGAATPTPPAILAEHGVPAELHVLTIGGRPLGAALLRRAHELSADMLIMGAYQHSPLRELLLGGVTRHMLGHADIPVLLRH
jgi:nucleotide-binding universal stress UspA family protein